MVAARSCEDCKKWWYDDGDKEGSGKFTFRNSIVSRGKRTANETKIERPSHAPTPCHHCPKGSPENAKALELSPKNLQAIEFYHRTVACGWRNLTEEMTADETLTANLTAIHAIHEQHKRQQDSGLILSVLEAAVGLAGS